MHKLFYAIYLFVRKHKLLAVGICLIYLAIFGYLSSGIRFEEDITKILPRNEKTSVTAKVFKQLNFADKITVIIEKEKDGSLEDMAALADVFLDSLQKCSSYIKNIEGQIDEGNIQETFDFVYGHLPFWLDSSDYAKINQKLGEDSVREKVQGNYRSLISPAGMITRDFILKDPLGISFMALNKLKQLNIGDDFIIHNGFITTKDSSKILLFINPVYEGSETEHNSHFAALLETIKQELNADFKPRASIDYFGASLIAVANAKQIKTDIQTTVIISMTALMLILIVFYRRIFIPFILFIPTIFAAVLALAFLYFYKETISAISLSVAAVLLGVTVDYSLHILTHYKHSADTKAMYKDITMPLIMSGTTNAAAFLCLLFVKSEALQDLGIFASICIFFSAVFSLLLIPHLYKPSEAKKLTENTGLIDRFSGFTFHRSKLLLGLCIVIVIVSCFTFHKVGFNNNLSDLNYIPDELKASEAKLEESTNLTSKSLYVAAYGNSPEEVLQQNQELYNRLQQSEKQGQIQTFSSIGGIVLSQEEQEKKLAEWNHFWTAEKKEKLQQDLIRSGEEIGFKKDAYQGFYDLLNKRFSLLSLEDYQQLESFPVRDFINEKDGFYTALSLVKVADQQRDDFVHSMEHQQKDIVIIDRQQVNETFLGKLKDDFNTLVDYSFIAVLIILFLFFRRIELVLIATAPIAITGLVTGGIMALFGIELNIFSTIVCTLVFGHGVDFSIFMTSAMQKQYTDGKTDISTYRTSIVLAVLTTVLAIGALVFARHPALKSISMVSLIGVMAALIITFVFYPILFKICISNRPEKGKSPISLYLLLASVFSFTYYGVGSIVLSGIGYCYIKLFPGDKEKKMLRYRKLMSVFMKSVLYTRPLCTKKVTNEYGEDFSRPSIIIANHTSFLDTLAIGMLHPNIIFMVNDWVYNSPIFGGAVRLAGFYPASRGLENGLPQLEEQLKKGYSLMIFPEGTRSESNSILRFHKGAFLLAEKYQLDILPIYIHGNSEALPKGDYIVYDEQITVVIGQRICPEDPDFTGSYDKRTKSISRHFKATFQEIRNQLEDENYFRKKLMLSFLYKEEDIIREVKTDFNRNKGKYIELDRLIAEATRITRIGNDYGQLDVLLALYKPKRKITTYISDQEKRAVAATNYLTKKRHIRYTEELTSEKDSVLLITAPVNKDELDRIIDKHKELALFLDLSLKDYIVSKGFSIQVENEYTILFNR